MVMLRDVFGTRLLPILDIFGFVPFIATAIGKEVTDLWQVSSGSGC